MYANHKHTTHKKYGKGPKGDYILRSFYHDFHVSNTNKTEKHSPYITNLILFQVTYMACESNAESGNTTDCQVSFCGLYH